MLNVIVPLYAIYCLLKFIFLIVFSSHGLPPTSSQIIYEGAVFANNLLLSTCYCAIAFSMLYLSLNQQNWNVRGGTTQLCSYTSHLKISRPIADTTIFQYLHNVSTAHDLTQLRQSMHDEQPHIVNVKVTMQQTRSESINVLTISRLGKVFCANNSQTWRKHNKARM